MTINLTSSDKEYKDSVEKARGISKVQLKKEPRLYVTPGTKGRGARGLGRFHEITEIFIDKDGRVFVGFKINDRSGYFYQYAIVGRLQVTQRGSVQ